MAKTFEYIANDIGKTVVSKKYLGVPDVRYCVYNARIVGDTD